MIDSLKGLGNSMDNFLNQTKNFFHMVDLVSYYATHPYAFIVKLWKFTVYYSFWVCMFICLFGTIAYIMGINKAKRYAKGSVFAYLIIQMFNSCLR